MSTESPKSIFHYIGILAAIVAISSGVGLSYKFTYDLGEKYGIKDGKLQTQPELDAARTAIMLMKVEEAANLKVARLAIYTGNVSNIAIVYGSSEKIQVCVNLDWQGTVLEANWDARSCTFDKQIVVTYPLTYDVAGKPLLGEPILAPGKYGDDLPKFENGDIN